MPDIDPDSPEFHAREIKKFARLLGIAAAALALLPVLLGWFITPDGHQYLPFHLSLDDHMVYSAWMHQAMDGQFLFDNRFTTDSQPGLTIHVYFLLLGLIAKVAGISVTLTLARIGFSFLAVKLLGDFLVRLGLNSTSGKFALVMVCFGGGLAYLSWETFGVALTGEGNAFSSLMQGLQPIDNWQPEAFVFPSMLTNGLFMMALCLILVTFNSVLDAKDSWKPVLPGALAFGVLMNVHSYDVLLVAMVLVTFLATLVFTKQFDKKWTVRTAVIGAAALPSALWFMYVLQNDPVFQARADTLTYTGSFRQILVGILPLFALAVLALVRSDLSKERRLFGGVGVVALALTLFALAGNHAEGYFMNMAGWIVAFVAAVGLTVLIAKKDVGWNLLWSWAMISLVAPYFPALFQRKLAMMLVVPWAIIAAIGLAKELHRLERQPRNFVAAVVLTVICMSSALWLRRDMELAKIGVSKTLVHNTTLTEDEVKIVEILNGVDGDFGVLAMPGAMYQPIGNRAFINDLAPVLSGLTGAYTVAGHWSETPDYVRKRAAVTQFYVMDIPIDQRLSMLKEWKVDYVVAPVPEAYPDIPFPDLSAIGEAVYSGEQLTLIKIRSEG